MLCVTILHISGDQIRRSDKTNWIIVAADAIVSE
jgi:hypothetical protein